VGRAGINYLLEVKVPGAKLNSREAAWHAKWQGQAEIVHGIAEALQAVGLEEAR